MPVPLAGEILQQSDCVVFKGQAKFVIDCISLVMASLSLSLLTQVHGRPGIGSERRAGKLGLDEL